MEQTGPPPPPPLLSAWGKRKWWGWCGGVAVCVCMLGWGGGILLVRGATWKSLEHEVGLTTIGATCQCNSGFPCRRQKATGNYNWQQQQPLPSGAASSFFFSRCDVRSRRACCVRAGTIICNVQVVFISTCTPYYFLWYNIRKWYILVLLT